MKSIPAILFLICAVVLFVSGAYNADQTLGLNIHDAYFITGYSEFTAIFSLIAVVLASVLFIAKRKNPDSSNTRGYLLLTVYLLVLLIVFATFVWQ